MLFATLFSGVLGGKLATVLYESQDCSGDSVTLSEQDVPGGVDCNQVVDMMGSCSAGGFGGGGGFSGGGSSGGGGFGPSAPTGTAMLDTSQQATCNSATGDMDTLFAACYDETNQCLWTKTGAFSCGAYMDNLEMKTAPWGGLGELTATDGVTVIRTSNGYVSPKGMWYCDEGCRVPTCSPTQTRSIASATYYVDGPLCSFCTEVTYDSYFCDEYQSESTITLWNTDNSRWVQNPNGSPVASPATAGRRRLSGTTSDGEIDMSGLTAVFEMIAALASGDMSALANVPAPEGVSQEAWEFLASGKARGVGYECKGALSTGAIIGIAGGCAALAVVVVVGLVCMRNKKIASETSTGVSAKTNEGSLEEAMDAGIGGERMPREGPIVEKEQKLNYAGTQDKKFIGDSTELHSFDIIDPVQSTPMMDKELIGDSSL